MRPFRFGLQLRASPGDDVIDAARRAEATGFDVVLLADHVGPGGLSPMPTLAAVATATTTIRLGTLVLNAEMRNPVQLAWEAATIDHLSGGRFELGLGAGHTPHEFAQCGVEMLPAAGRKRHLMAQVELIRALLDGEMASSLPLGVVAASIDRAMQDRLPILVGGNGAALLAHAGAHADIIGLQGLGRTLEDGHRHEVRWATEHLDRQLDQVRHGAGARFDELELNALVQVVEITDDADAAIEALCEQIPTLDPSEVRELPYVLVGTVDEIVAKLHRCRDRWGISYFAVRALEEFAPVVAAANR
ncbi:MAG TPA: TIGR03621 family F420-dependent LLM class oxidoreductase [Ilumatobacter sp.]|nr:TIGR03621 family F420-dependent LLM class oxidoreductase [Ilumatobacter sp.]